MKSFAELSEESPPDFLYHYTSVDSVLKIVESKSVWASKIHYLNDAEEFKYAVRKVRLLLKSKIEEAKLDDLKKFIEAVSDSLDHTEGINVCLFSLSEEGDLLSQWRGYCPPEGGMAIGFNSAALKQIVATQPHLFWEALLRCIYDEAHQEALLQPIVDSLVSELQEVVLRAVEGDAQNRALENTKVRFFEMFLPIASIIKNGAFREEKEWRLCGLMHRHSINFRAGRSMLIPYYRWSLESDSVSFPISKIIIGPSPHQELSQGSMDRFLHRQGWRNCECLRSDVPFRTL